MPCYQYEAVTACAPNTSLPPGAPPSGGYDRRDHGVVGIGACDQTLAARSAQVACCFSFPGISREKYRRRRTDILPRNQTAAPPQGSLTEVKDQSPTWHF